MKRSFDIVVSALALVFLAPLLLLLALLVRWKLGSPVIFSQERIGLNGKTFVLRKFRTMTDARDAAGRLLPDEARLPAFGRWLRATSLDELPELWNILVGEMSLVGPRPLPEMYRHRYTAEQFRRHSVRPGLTGWAQVNGRNAQTWEARFALDLHYVAHASLALDLRILWQTLITVIRREGVAAEGQATMTEFLGTPAPDAPAGEASDPPPCCKK
ncbi:MAG: sugar transferase [Opitutales bacterium]|nr:sugar transferase [Opitutales bacterium]